MLLPNILPIYLHLTVMVRIYFNLHKLMSIHIYSIYIFFV